MLAGNDVVSNIVYHALAQSFAIDAVIRETKPPVATFLRRRIKKLGLGRVLGQLLFVAGILPFVNYRSKHRRREIISSNRLDASEIPGTCLIEVPSVNSDASVNELQRLSPRVVIVNGTRIIQEKVLQCIDAVFLNIHAGITP